MNLLDTSASTREDSLFAELQRQQHRATSRMFVWLMGLQWVAAIAASLLISPYTWIGSRQQVHEHVWFAIILGALLAGVPMFLAIARPTCMVTRHVVAIAQISFSALFIHLTGGRIETHFHVFGSLAFLAFYRDRGVLITATLVATGDHAVRGLLVPLSVFGTLTPGNWRWVEHAAWVVFEDVFLFISCRRGILELRAIASRQAGLEQSREATEQRVLERTSELEDANKSLVHAATHDRLTNLLNRSVLRSRIARAIDDHTANPARGFALCFIDFDRFKVINDSLGHEAGDRLLISAAERLRLFTRSATCTALCRVATPARMGGDEFVILFEGMADPRQASVLSQAVLHELSSKVSEEATQVGITVSIGVTTSDIAYSDPSHVLRDADTAMYRAKALGKNRYVEFDRKMHDAVSERFRLESEMRGMVERGELVLHYQPIVSVESGALRGFEALVRWNHPTRGLLSPDTFIPCAEDCGSVAAIGRWVLHEGCRQAAAWLRSGTLGRDFTVSVNVSAQQLSSGAILDYVCDALRCASLAPEMLVLEITESAVIADPKYATELLKELKRVGVKLHLDDFGTGYTSLSYLHKLPMDAVKLDRSFLTSLAARREHAAIIHSIVDLAHNLGIKVIAEGVELQDQVALLRALDCDHAQGYFFGRPAPADAALTHASVLLARSAAA